MFDGVPNEWRHVALSDLAEIVTAGISADELATKPEVHHYSLPAFDLGDGPEVGPGKAIKSNKTVVPSDCILFSKLNPRIPRIWRVKGIASSDSYCSTEFWPLVRKAAQVDLDFLAYFLGSAAFLGDPAIVPSSSTNSHQRVDRRSFESFVLYLPPLDEQRRIAEVLRSVDQAVLQATRVVEQEALVRSELVSATLSGAGNDQIQQSKIGELPAHWEVEPLENVCRSVGVGIASSATHAYCEAGVPLIRNQNIKPGYLDLSDLLFVNAEYDQGYASKRVHTGDVITMRTGYPGRSAVVPRELDGCQTFTTLITKPRADRILPEFLCEWINSPTGMREVRKLQAGGAQQNLNAGVLKRLPVPVPPLEEQDRIVDALSSFTRSSHALEAARGVQKCLAIDLLSGRVRVPA